MKLRLFHRIYLSFLGVVLVCVSVAGFAARLAIKKTEVPENLRAVAMLLVDHIEADETDTRTLQEKLDALAAELHMDLCVWNADEDVLASTGSPWSSDFGPTEGLHHDRQRNGFVITLDDGRKLGIAHHRKHDLAHLAMLGVLLAIMAVGCYPLSRSITRRLERLQKGVEDLGEGELSARVTPAGNDEVADLANSFNRAASRIERLVEHQQTMLANASHELRSPLARLMMAVELIKDAKAEAKPETFLELSKNINELDALIGDILLASRLDASSSQLAIEDVDLTALLQEEAARVGAKSFGDQVIAPGDPKLLRRLMRNLLENAARYSDNVEAWTEDLPSAAKLVVADRGPGVPTEEQERIFEPFYRPQGHDDGKHGNAGLGLALVKQIAERHGGRVRYVPREGQGSRFEVELPRE